MAVTVFLDDEARQTRQKVKDLRLVWKKEWILIRSFEIPLSFGDTRQKNKAPNIFFMSIISKMEDR